MKNKINIKNKKVLVTGGAGFIGSNLCEALLKLDNEVVCLDNFSTGKMENIVHLIPNPNFKLIGGDIRNEQDCEKACDGVDFVLHQAVVGPVPNASVDPITTNNVNVSGFLNMLTVANEAKVKRFVYVTSSSFAASSSLYGLTKHVNDLYADKFNKMYDLNIVGIPFSAINKASNANALKKLVQLNIEMLSVAATSKSDTCLKEILEVE